MMENEQQLLSDIRNCTICREFLPLGPKPVLQFSAEARILIAGQAPGLKVYETGVPFNDASGDRLRDWMGVDRQTFYDADRIAILPMGFCYPGKGKSGDLPPRPECAEAWRAQLLSHLSHLQLTLVIGNYAMAYHLPDAKASLTDTVRAWSTYWPAIMPLPHPSPRNNIWLKRNPWFELEVLPALKQRVSEAITR
jgi:uracil-DNA glycosylase